MNALHERFPSVKREGIVTDPRYWATAAGYEFFAAVGHTDIEGTMSATNDGFSGYGWTNEGSGFAQVDGTTGDLLSSADIIPTRAGVQNALDGVTSPRIFGSYDHALQASRFLGYFPTRLTLEVFAQCASETTNETSTFFGLCAPGVTDSVSAGSAACITSNATNFVLKSDNGSDTGAAVDNTFRLWKIVVDATNTEWFMNGVSQGTITTEADIWPQSFRIYTNSGLNDFVLCWLRIFYS